jgi:hypothetical protein
MGSSRFGEVPGSALLVAPQGTTRDETKGDVVFSTIFPKSFPKRDLMMCIPVY